MTTCTFSLRAARVADRPFLLHLFTLDKTEELQAGHWDAALRDQIMAQQFAAHEQHYRSHCPGADHGIALANDQPVGRLTLADQGMRLHVMDLALLPEWRGRGLGTWLIKHCQARAADLCRPLSLFCLRESRAMALYQRLGFEITNRDVLHACMEWNPAPPGSMTKSG